MGFWRRVFAGEGLFPEKRQDFVPRSHFIPPPGDAFFEAGEAVTERTAMQHATVWACVRLLADSVAQLPVDAFVNRDGRRVEVPSRLLNDTGGGGWHDPLRLKVNDYEWKHQAMVSLALRGNLWALVVERDSFEFPISLQVIHPDDVQVERDVTDRFGLPRIRIGGEVVRNRDVFHVPWMRSPGEVEGLSPVRYARVVIGLGLAADKFGANWFRDGAPASSLLETDQDLSDDEIRRAQESWVQSNAGRRRPAVLTGGFKWRPITLRPEESQFLETRQFQVSEIARWFGVPPWMIGDVEKSTSWGSGIEQQGIGFVRYTLGPWLSRLEAALSDLLPRGQYVKFNVNALLRADMAARAQFYFMLRQIGALNADEVRALEEMSPIPGGAGQDYNQPLNWGPLGAEPTEVANDDAD